MATLMGATQAQLWFKVATAVSTEQQPVGAQPAAVTAAAAQFSKSRRTGIFTTLYSFSGAAADGSHPYAALIQGSDGAFYGATESGGTGSSCAGGCGAVFKITSAGMETLLYSFGGTLSSPGDDGTSPIAVQVQGSDGNFYGTTPIGGTGITSFNAPNGGTVFKITPAGVETVLYNFGSKPNDGTHPGSAMVLGSDGNFYGTTSSGGTSTSCGSIGGYNLGCGTVFKITPAGVETVLYSFDGGSDGDSPTALVQGSDGSFYGTSGGESHGMVFKVTKAGVKTSLYSFGNETIDGGEPVAGLVQARDGNFYGTTAIGGMYNHGTAFEITPAGIFTLLYAFGSQANDGQPNFGDGGNSVEPALIQGNDGYFYGTTQAGGTSDGGTVFKLTVSEN